MSLSAAAPGPAAPLLPGAEKSASSSSSARTPAVATKLRSCVVCRSRKVRCDKQSPCSNCRRANIPCVLPATDRPPRWVRRLEHLPRPAATHNAVPDLKKAMDRLQVLEGLVSELRGQLEDARATTSSVGDTSSGAIDSRNSTQESDEVQHITTMPASEASAVQKQFGRLVLQDSSHGRYVSSGFWSRVNDEVTFACSPRALFSSEHSTNFCCSWMGSRSTPAAW